MATSRVSVNVDEEVKRRAQHIFIEMGLDMTTAIDSFLRTVVREERIPFSLQTERSYREMTAYINAELDKSMLEAEDPNTKWLSHEEMTARIDERREVRNRV